MSILRNKSLLYFLLACSYAFFIYLISERTGILIRNESEKYLTAAHELLSGNFNAIKEKLFFYSSYVVFVSIFITAGGVNAVIIAQAVVSFLASVCLKRSINEFLKNDQLSTAGMLIFLFSFPIQSWTLTLFSDSFFVSIITITLYYTLKTKKKKDVLLWIFLLVVLLFARPPGIFLCILFFLFFLKKNKLFRSGNIIVLSLIFYFVIFLALFYIPVETKGYIKPIASGSVIIDKSDYDIPVFNEVQKSTLAEAYVYLYHQHGGNFIASLYFQKLFSFFVLTRPYYSTTHNLLLYFHYLLYPLSLAGLIYLFRKGKKKEALLLLFSIFACANLTAITYNEWHYRFSLTIFPNLIILSCLGSNFIYSYINNYKVKQS